MHLSKKHLVQLSKLPPFGLPPPPSEFSVALRDRKGGGGGAGYGYFLEQLK